MTPRWRTETPPELIRALAAVPGEAPRGYTNELLRAGLGAPYSKVAHAVHLLKGSGRNDTLWNTPVVELKSNLQRAAADMQARRRPN